MRIAAFILNLPYTSVGLLCAFISLPKRISWNSGAFVVHISTFWWAFGYMKGMRAATIGHVVLLGPNTLHGDLEHELVHVEQYKRYPFLFPFLYYIELFRKGYRENKYEREAYEKAQNEFVSK